ncbi:MAG TPA: Rieske 2Fe-2S domain-containing protein [Gemmataceae bacterium]|jgi:phenylpropionate dioxygenase-like ring-hydroxylating dioxygenase large terminal subunit|nr:Rieske 2Fe-2S domain-containing protein [Gemmataceae bacterium]
MALQQERPALEPEDIARRPRQGLLAEWPAAWYVFCASRELGQKPVNRRALGRELVAFRTATGRVGVMLAQCVHMGANLGQGQVVNDCLRCPFHHWAFDVNGQCRAIPAAGEIPSFARQLAFPAVERHGLIFFFNAPEPLFPLPFFGGCTEDDLTAAPAFTLVLDCPWYMIGANGVDVQHFLTTHDRELVGAPDIRYPEAFVHEAINRFRVVGRGWRDRLTRRIAGNTVTMHVTDWAGTLFFVQARFRRTRTFGMVSMLPVDRSRTLLYVRVSVRRSRGLAARMLVDPVNARVRRFFIRKFLEPDIARSAGTRYNPQRLIGADRCLADYFAWLRTLHGAGCLR